jgi:hypothetical protein
MTYFLNFRAQPVGGYGKDPVLFQGDGTTDPPALAIIPESQYRQILYGKRILFATHGFNVNYRAGARALGKLDQYLGLGDPALFIGMLWPGDSWLPVVDYPFEGNVAIDCGKRLAAFCNAYCTTARSLSFMSHSLGARLLLAALLHVDRDVDLLCIMAGAINRNCLTAEYAEALHNVRTVVGLSSHKDDVLKLAYAVGDPIADLLHDDHTPFQAALGYDGPALPAPPDVLWPWQIPDLPPYTHGDYLPSDGTTLWQRPANFLKAAFLGRPRPWP